MKRLRNSNPPNYDSLPIVIFNLPGYQAVLPIPDNSGSVATDLAKTEISLDDFQWQDSDPPYREICLDLVNNLSWDVGGIGTASPIGRLRVGVGIMENRANLFDFREDRSFKDWMITRNRENYGCINDEISKERELNGLDCPPEYLFLFAERPEDISTLYVNGQKWFVEKSGCPHGGSEISQSFRAPLNSKYSFNVEFDWSAPPETYEVFKAEVDELQLEYLQNVRLIPSS